jgi:hypothetical protein
MSIVKLYQLTPKEVASGYIEQAGKSKTASIENLFADIRKVIPIDSEAMRVIANLQDILDQRSGDQDSRSQVLTTVSSKPEDALLVGARPVGTCQHYATGEYREALLAFVIDPNSQVVVSQTEKGSHIGRSIIRLLSTKEGNPEIHLEHTYTNVSSSEVKRQITLAAAMLAHNMGVPLNVSRYSQNEKGSMTEAPRIEGFEYELPDEVLYSNASRAPKVYVDSAGGIQSLGKYFVADMQKVSMVM